MKLSIAENIFAYDGVFSCKAQGIGFIQIAFALFSNPRLQALGISGASVVQGPTKQLVRTLLLRNRGEAFDETTLSSLLAEQRARFSAGYEIAKRCKIVPLGPSSWMTDERDDEEIKEMEEKGHLMPSL